MTYRVDSSVSLWSNQVRYSDIDIMNTGTGPDRRMDIIRYGRFGIGTDINSTSAPRHDRRILVIWKGQHVHSRRTRFLGL